MLASLVELVSLRFAGSPVVCERVSSGFSGTQIYRVCVQDQTYALRSWPLSQESQRKVHLWNHAAQCLARLESDFLPEFQGSPIPVPLCWNEINTSDGLLAVKGDSYWSIAPWMPGKPMTLHEGRKISKATLAMQLAKLHRLLRSSGNSFGTPQGLVDRIDGLLRLSQTRRVRGDLPSYPLLNQYFQVVHTHSSMWTVTLQTLLSKDRRLHWIIRDLWRENLLVDEAGHWCSTVDVGASRRDWPALDFVRLFGSLRCSKAEWRDAYHSYMSHSGDEPLASLADCLLLHKVSMAVSINFWIDTLYNDSQYSENVQPSDAQRSYRTKGFLRLEELLDEFLSDEMNESRTNLG